MNYTGEEIEFVKFCANNIDCSIVKCPLSESCEEGNEICSSIPPKMESSIELSSDDKEIIRYFMVMEKQLWKKGRCIPKGTDKRCPNANICDGIVDQQKYICVGLIKKLGLLEEDELQVLESEIQKVVINNLNSIDWEVGEKLQYYAHESPIDIGRPDIVLQGNESNRLYIIELKPARARREDVGQLQSYVGWYKKNMPAQFKAVIGILLAKELDDGAKYALEANPDLQARVFDLRIEIKRAK